MGYKIVFIVQDKGCYTPSRYWEEAEVQLYPYSNSVLEGGG